MDRAIYDRMAEHDTTHWWYQARREVLTSVITRIVRPPFDARILEIGCGTGHNLAMLGHFGMVDAIEIDAESRRIAQARLGRSVGAAPLPELTGVPDQHYDLIALLDVLEHVEDDRAALASIARRLRPGGQVLLTVPQYPWMWGGHDIANHHRRRYTRKTLQTVIADAGFGVKLLQSFNSLLFPLALADRLAARLTGRAGSDDRPPPAPVNALFTHIFGVERYLIGRMPMPPGLSLIAVLSAPKSAR